jgi:hypothetical protein
MAALITVIHDLLNFVGESVQMLMQPVEHLSLRLIRSQVSDDRSLSRVLAKLFEGRSGSPS